MIPGKAYTPEDVIQIAWRRKWVIVLPAILIAISVIAWTRSLVDEYRSDTLILVVPQRVPENYVRSTVTASVADRLESISQQVLSRTRLERIILDLNLYPEKRKTAIMEDIVDQMRSQISMQPVKGDAFRVSFTSEDPRTAMRVAERVASLFIDESLRDREVLAEGTSQFLEAQLEDARRQLVDNEKKLENYRRTHAGQLPNQLDANMQGLNSTQLQIQSLQDSMNRDRDRREIIQRQIAELESAEYVPPPPTAPVQPKETAADRLHAAEEQFKQMQMRLKPDHPDIVRARKTLAELQKVADDEAAQAPVSIIEDPIPVAERTRRRLLNEAHVELTNIDKGLVAKEQQEKTLHQTLGDYQSRIEAIPTRESELIELTRDYGTLQEQYRSLLAKKQESQISANLERRQIGEQFRILDPARLPARPFTPNRPRFYGMGIVGGIAFGLALAGLLEYLDRSMRSEDDIRAALNLPVLATIPMIFDRARVRRRRLLAASAVATAALLAGVAFVALRVLR